MGGFQRFCTQCGRELKPGGRFCTVCGHAAPEPAVLPAPTAPPPVSTSSAETVTRNRPQWPLSGPGSGPPLAGPDSGPPPRPPDPEPWHGDSGLAEPARRSYTWLLVLGLVVILAGGAAAAFLVLHRHHNSTANTSATSNHPAQHPTLGSSTGSSTTSASAQPPEQQAADSLSALLAQSVSDRSAIVSAVNDVNACGPNLSQDVQTFQNAATSRQTLLSQLANLPDSSALPASMLQALTSAWQASMQADQDYAGWAQDEVSQGCVPNDHSDSNYQAAGGPDGQATTGKKAFVSSWNPIATQYGLPTYQWDQL
jgi:hypothetical protein